MTVSDGRRALAASSAALTEALDPALAAAAEALAAEARRRLGAVDGRPGAVVTGPAGAGRVGLCVTAPDAVAREYGSLRGGARPFLRPAIAAAWPAIRQGLADALRHAVSRRSTR